MCCLELHLHDWDPMGRCTQSIHVTWTRIKKTLPGNTMMQWLMMSIQLTIPAWWSVDADANCPEYLPWFYICATWYYMILDWVLRVKVHAPVWNNCLVNETLHKSSKVSHSEKNIGKGESSGMMGPKYRPAGDLLRSVWRLSGIRLPRDVLPWGHIPFVQINQ